MNATQPHPLAGHRRPSIFALRTIASALPGFLAWIDHRFTRASQYAALEELDDHLLKDIGLTRKDVRRARPRWFG